MPQTDDTVCHDLITIKDHQSLLIDHELILGGNKSIVGNCHLCHAFWVPIPTSTQTSQPRFAHANIELNHGSNDRCYNCHQIDDRNNYAANDGSDIMVQIPEKLCERCHGLIYQDWLAGTHGKWTGR